MKKIKNKKYCDNCGGLLRYYQDNVKSCISCARPVIGYEGGKWKYHKSSSESYSSLDSDNLLTQFF